jgi:acyl carrier protein
MKTENKQEVFDQLKTFASGIIGDDVVDIVGFHRESEFVNDFEMDSIKIVAFAEMVNQRYGKHVDFMKWMARKSLWRMTRLTVGEVTDFISEELRRKERTA